MTYKNLLLKPNDKLKAAIEVLNASPLKTVIVVRGNALIGTLTDGDIRRGLLAGKNLSSSVVEVMCQAPIFAHLSTSVAELVALCGTNKITESPLLDDSGALADVFQLQSTNSKRLRDNPVFLMAGGFGKRLMPLTETVPKPMLKLGGRPILETIIRKLIGDGFHRFFVSTHYKAGIIQDHFGDGSAFGVTIEYVHEADPLGTAGAIGLLPSSFGDLPFILMNGDLVTDLDFVGLIEAHESSGVTATVCTREYEYTLPFGVLQEKDGRITGLMEKPTQSVWIHAGIYVLSGTVRKLVKPNTRIDMPDLINKLAGSNLPLEKFPIHEYWLDIGRPDQLSTVDLDVINRMVGSAIHG